MAYTDYLDRVQEIYIGYYQRPADPAGLVYWAARLDASGGNMDEIIAAFANSPEAQALYPNISVATIDAIINQIYQNLFGRDAEPEGIAFYHNGFVNGTFTAATIMTNILDGATGLDALSVDNKVAAANIFTETVDPGLDHADIQVTYSGEADAIAARDFLDGVTWDPNTLPTQAQTTNFIIASGIADPGDAILTHPQTALTEETDFIDLEATGGITTVTGVQSEDGTFTNGDTILGNGLTEVNLIADGGTGIFATINDVAKIDITGATDSTIEAMLFDNVSEINYVNGAGVQIFVDNLQLGTQIGVSDVGGTISASYDAGAAQAYGWLYNGSSDDDDASTFLIDADRNIAMDLADSMSGSGGFWNGPVNVGTVSVTQGDNTLGNIWFSASGTDAAAGDDVVVGDVTVAIGDGSSFTLSIDSNDEVTVGDVAMTAGDGSALSYSIDYVDGAVAVGDIDVTVGNSSSAYVDLNSYGAMTVGDVNMQGGDDVDLTFLIEDVYDTVTGVSVGDITMVAGDSADLEVLIGTCDISSDLIVGNVNLTAGDGSYVSISSPYISGDMTYGDIAISAGDDSTVYGYFGFSTDGNNLTMGNVDITVGNDGYVDFSADNDFSWTEGIDIGDVNILAGDDSYVNFYAYNTASGTADTAATVDAGDVTVGNISVEVGSVTSISSTATASVSIGSWATTGVAGDLTVGDINITLGDGYVSNTVTTEAYGLVWLDLTGEEGAGAMTAGDITMTAGDFASLTLNAEHFVGTGDLGAFSMGDVAFDAGESANVVFDIENTVSSGDAGDFTLGNVEVMMAQDSFASVSISNYAYSGNLGATTVGDVTIISGDNSTANLYISSYASGSNGAMTVGDITVAMSATTTEDLIGGSTIFVSLEHYGWGSGDAFGEMTVGDIDLSAGDTADIDLYLYNEATAEVVGDETIGNITITAGDASSRLRSIATTLPRWTPAPSPRWVISHSLA